MELPYHVLDDSVQSDSMLQSGYLEASEGSQRTEDNGTEDTLATSSSDGSCTTGSVASESNGLQSDGSYNSIGYQEPIAGLPPGTFVEIYRERQGHAQESEDESFSGTILSSAASSQAYITPPSAAQSYDAWAISPHPEIAVGNPLSVSTTESIYRNEGSLAPASHDGSSLTDDSFLSLRPSMVHSSMIDESHGLPSDESVDTRESSEPAQQHGRESFLNVASRLSVEGAEGAWFSRFSDRDWIKFRGEADMVLNALEPPQTDSPPPRSAPPNVPIVPADVPENMSYNARDVLPEAFLCSLCEDVIVGAITLSCACPQSTVCKRCWDASRTLVVDGEKGEPTFTVVNVNSACPFCHKNVEQAVPCHALDAAILYCVKSLPEGLPLQTAFYRRVQAWKSEVECGGHGEAVNDEERDRLLAQLIQREEELLWRQDKRRRQQHGNSRWNMSRSWKALGDMALFLVGAGISIGAIAFVRRRR